MFKKLSDLGAVAVMGTLYLNRVAVGTFEGGGLVLTAKGEAALAEIGASEAVPAKPVKVKASKPVETVGLDELLFE